MTSFAGFPNYEMLQARTREQQRLASRLLEVQPLGQSRSGREIELISIGAGPCSALVVGAPHPNEPIGCVTIERLLDRLIEDETLRTGLGYRWHFIKAIDPDGLHLNSGWLGAPLTPENYLEHFFRPALSRQPEYTFPLTVGTDVIDCLTPENQCWRAALDLTKPDLQVSLHNADFGGVFYLLSKDVQILARDLAKDPTSYGLTLNPVGEPFSEMERFAEGVFAFPDLAELARQCSAEGHSLQKVWPAGNSSEGYARQKYGTFSLVCEVPLWDHPRLRDQSISTVSIRDIARQQLARNSDLCAILDHHLPELSSQHLTDGAQQLVAALHETANSIQRQNGSQSGLRGKSKPLTVGEAVLYDGFLCLVSARPYGHLLRLAEDILQGGTNQNAENAQLAARQGIRFITRSLSGNGGMTPVSIEDATDLQMRAILKTAKMIALGSTQ